jgi:hypothetical protein
MELGWLEPVTIVSSGIVSFLVSVAYSSVHQSFLTF